MKEFYNILVFALFFSIIGCSDSGELEFDLSKEFQEIHLQSNFRYTTQAFISLSGTCDCTVKVQIERANKIILNPKVIKHNDCLEWYTSPRFIKVYSRGCTPKSRLKMKYKFVHDLI